MVRFVAFDVPPPGLGVTTVTGNVPAVVSWAAGITAVNCAELAKVVTSEVPLSCTVDCGVKLVPVTVSVVSVLPASTVGGEMESRTGTGLMTVTEAVPARVGSATLVAFTVTPFGEGGTAGAVYMPVASIVPTEESPPGIPFTAHVTEVLDVPLTVALNCSFSRTMAVVLLGETETEMMRTLGGALLPPPPHPTDRTRCSRAAAQRNALWVPSFMTAV
jgi:hypothetical protein